MKRFITITIACFIVLISHAQIAPILDHTWTIEQIDTGTQIINADLNPSGQYDTIKLISLGVLDETTFYQPENVIFGHCEMLFSFDDINSELFYHLQGCLLSNDNSSDIALYFNDIFIEQNTTSITIDNDFFPFAFGPLTYSFTSVGDMIYMDITNSIGEVATFSAANLSQDEFLKQNLVIYPNPVNDKLFIKSPNIALEHVNIYDLSGKLVFEQNDISNGNLNISHLQSGVYILKIKTPVGVLQRKLVKE
ncbi:T9SS type A sorting domain-containing protein [Mesohalobacter halotolerans]|uniref:T9SS type A sorting domain-containing protein n=1 Tax=Mesohalobacter halotolerans TaxID=1883405 RepID=A0A4U5TQX4_9FLAO|nr:T9SS type A sorting domain-containing protein [Mesohalobacter halotolerans]MBS3739004.1 T9SS type A sorting domain-containing protein [Psychroflexus sp.]TKS55788.1 T9SS type A sorting domain-containing protein [Mesohalobacter halotolerans]